MTETLKDLSQEASVAHSDMIDDVAQFLPRVKGRQAFSRFIAIILLILTDLTSLSASVMLAFFLRVNVLPSLVPILRPEMPPYFTSRIWWVLGIGLLCLIYEGLYKKRLTFWRETRQMVKAVTLAFLLLFTLISISRMSYEVSRSVLLLGYFFSLIGLPLGRLITKTVLSRIGIGMQTVLILGVGKTGKLVAQAMLRDKFSGYRIIGFLDDDPVKRSHDVEIDGTLFPVLGGFQEAGTVMDQTGVRHLIVAAPGMPPRDMVKLVNRLQRQSASVTIIPDLFGVPVMGVEVDYSFDDQIVSLRIRNRLANPLNVAAKRLFDLTVSAFASFIILPIMAIIALAIRINSPGPVVFSHRRIGRGGNEFDCYKFRTMVVNAQEVLDELLENDPDLQAEWEKSFKLKDDPRVTRVGKFLRKTSLDELPQFFNVLKGEMSLVGPRPIVQKEMPRFEHSASYYFMVRPGIAGLWQVSGRNDIDYPERVRLESWYVRNWSLWLDITILIRTIGVVLAKRGAY